jgi:sec-independent protein translocase protein TatA
MLAVNLGPTELIIVLAIMLLIFGSTRVPALARSLGQAAKELRRAAHDDDPGDARS